MRIHNKKNSAKFGRPRAVLLPVAKHNGHWSKGQGQEKRKAKSSGAPDAAAEAAAAASAELDSMRDQEEEITKDKSKDRAKDRSQADKQGSSQNADENSSDEDDNFQAAGPAAAAQSRHVTADHAKTIADLQRQLAATQVIIQP